MIATLDDLAKLANYSLMDTLNCDPDAKANGADHAPRQVFTGHYVPVNPTPIKDPEYVAHSKNFFRELGFADSMALSADFVRMFSGDISHVPEPMRKVGWACGYARSIFGTEYYQQCPFQSGNGRAKQIRAAIRAHLATGQPAVSDALRAAIPSAAEIRAKVAQVLEKEINPSVAAHGGRFPDTRFTI